MARFLCVLALSFFAAAARGSEYGSARNVDDSLLAERSTHADAHLVKRARAAQLVRRDKAEKILPPNGKTVEVSNEPRLKDPHNGKPGETVSYSIDTVRGSYNGLLLQVKSCQSALETGRIRVDSATKQVQELAAQFEADFFKFQRCGPCYAHSSINTFGSIFSDVFSALVSLFLSFRKFFTNWTSILRGPFSGIDRSMDDFLTLCQKNGLAVKNFIPQTLGQFLDPLGMTYTKSTLQRSGYSV